MARLIRMDRSGHSTLAEWTTVQDPGLSHAALSEFRKQVELGYIASVPDGPARPPVACRVRRTS